jgi:RimJ/RimL family protein N-acetyltransferase
MSSYCHHHGTADGCIPPSIIPEATVTPWSGHACHVVAITRPLIEPQYQTLRTFARRISRESLRLRFGQAADFADARTLERFFGIKGDGDEMLWMLDEGGAICGIVHLVRVSPTRAEIALIVRSDRARRGIGERLLRAALTRTSRQGLAALDAFVLYENIPMLRLARKVGFESRDAHGLSVALEFDLDRIRRGDKNLVGAYAVAPSDAGGAVAG